MGSCWHVHRSQPRSRQFCLSPRVSVKTAILTNRTGRHQSDGGLSSTRRQVGSQPDQSRGHAFYRKARAQQTWYSFPAKVLFICERTDHGFATPGAYTEGSLGSCGQSHLPGKTGIINSKVQFLCCPCAFGGKECNLLSDVCLPASKKGQWREEEQGVQGALHAAGPDEGAGSMSPSASAISRATGIGTGKARIDFRNPLLVLEQA